ncbi:hypothetical protein E2C01_000703 [Portunus trituberculatus]|uniref:Uncharacterized protein n=1 Tax=Portunus trituberculatus TaxID=210409 RepID=A0A5B7CFC4_PORTR|nr:hypothetical protein [Portunus trituberculatus]
MKKCCSGTESESNWRPNLREDSMSSFTTNLQMFTRWEGSKSGGARIARGSSVQQGCQGNIKKKACGRTTAERHIGREEPRREAREHAECPAHCPALRSQGGVVRRGAPIGRSLRGVGRVWWVQHQWLREG